MGDVARLSGALLPADPSAALEAATKQYVDAKVGGDIVGGIRTTYRSTDISIVSQATYSTFLSISVTSGATYLVDGYILYNSPTAADLGINYTGVGATSWLSVFGINLAATGAGPNTFYSTAEKGTAGSGSGGDGTTTASNQIAALPLRGYIIPNAASFAINFAQQTSNATATVIRAGTWMRLQRVA